jgi:NAD(P)-dependent dehydrogenase (short-subunit alcohol dehydrogenase family)
MGSSAKLLNQTVLITGAGNGMAGAISGGMAREGADVIVNYIDKASI